MKYQRLSNNKLSGEIPKELGQLTGLQESLLHNNTLIVLWLSSNELTGEMLITRNHADIQEFLEKCRNNKVSCINCYRHDYLISC